MKEKSYSNVKFVQLAFLQLAGLKGHISSVHEKKKLYKCSNCDSSFANHYDTKFHIASVHDGKKQLECNICNASVVLKAGLDELISLEQNIHWRNTFQQ